VRPFIAELKRPEHVHVLPRQLLRSMDVLDEYSDKLRTRLATLMRPLIDQDLLLVFFGLTTVVVTGQSDFEDIVRAYGRANSGLIERQFMLSPVQTAKALAAFDCLLGQFQAEAGRAISDEPHRCVGGVGALVMLGHGFFLVFRRVLRCGRCVPVSC
jgi:hypothetical protein